MEGCKCQGCGRRYRVDLIIPDDLWERVKPKGKAEGAGLLCGSCIMKRIEIISDFDVWELVRRKRETENSESEVEKKGEDEA